MMRILNIIIITLIILLSSALLVLAIDTLCHKSDIIISEKIEKSILPIIIIDEYGNISGGCTGVIIKNTFPVQMLTAKHCVEQDNQIYSIKADGQESIKVIISTDKDLALLIFDKQFKNNSATKIAKDDKFIQIVYFLGYVHEEMTITSQGISIKDVTSDTYQRRAKLKTQKGTSGTGIFNSDDQLIGIHHSGSTLQSIHNSTFTNLAGIKEFLLFAKHYYVNDIINNPPSTLVSP